MSYLMIRVFRDILKKARLSSVSLLLKKGGPFLPTTCLIGSEQNSSRCSCGGTGGG